MDSCPATEARLISEFRRNPYARAVLLVTMARFRHKTGDQEALLLEASALLRYKRVLGGFRPARPYTIDSDVPPNDAELHFVGERNLSMLWFVFQFWFVSGTSIIRPRLDPSGGQLKCDNQLTNQINLKHAFNVRRSPIIDLIQN